MTTIPAGMSHLPYQSAQRWKEMCLLSDGSLFTPDRKIWTRAVLDDAYQRIVASPDTTARGFRDKFRDQLKGAPDATIQLAAEALYVYLLITVRVRAKKKREIVEEVLAWMSEPTGIPSELLDATPHGIVGTGTSFNMHRWHYLCQILIPVRHLKGLSSEEREKLLSDPWAFSDFLEQDAFRKAEPQRSALRHLLFPDTFEPIVSRHHKRRIVEAFRDHAGDTTAPYDRQLRHIRQSLARDATGPVHFYREPWHSKWMQDKRPPIISKRKQRWAEILHATFAVLESSDGPMKRSALEQAVAQQLAPTEAERVIHPRAGRTKFEMIIARCAGRAVRAGLMNRRHGVWELTAAGRDAFRRSEGPRELYLETDVQRGHRKLVGPAEPTPYAGPVEDFSRIPKSIFTREFATVNHLVSSIQHRTLGLPDIQRPFVWNNSKVRDLFDSMYRGFPVGYLLQWNTIADGRQIGVEQREASQPTTLIIDGQQRLTSLYAVMTGSRILDKRFQERRIRIAFHPLSASFEVTDAAIMKDVEWIADISELFRDGSAAYHVIKDYLSRLRKVRQLTPDQESTAAANLERLLNLTNYEFGILKIGADVDEEKVAEIFVRVNSKGQNLKQADFILTLLSIFWKEGREELESFSRACQEPPKKGVASPYNHLIAPGPDGLLRVAIAVGLRRARLRSAYQILSGKDPNTGEFSVDVRDRNLDLLKGAHARVIDLENWHDYLKCLLRAGFRSPEQLWSGTTVLYSYVFFLLGRTEYGLEEKRLRRLISRFFYFATLTGRYTYGSTETAMEGDLARLRAAEDAKDYERLLEEWMASELTSDFWAVTLPAHLETSSPRGLSAWHAAQCRLNVKALYSDLSVSDLLDPAISAKKKAVEVHHLFPRAWLKRHGHPSVRDINQIANYALVEWRDNIDISDAGPRAYVPGYDQRCYPSDEDRREAYRLHGLPDRWYEMQYGDFLRERRKKMAAVIREGYEGL